MVRCWRGYLSGARCRLAYGPADATATHRLLLHLSPDWFCLLVPAHPGSPGKRAVKRVCVYVCVCVIFYLRICFYGFSVLEQKFGIFDISYLLYVPSVLWLLLLVGRQKEHPACKN